MRTFTAALLLLASACSADPAPIDSDLPLPASFPAPFIPADNPYTAEKAELGRHLFYDERLSGNGEHWIQIESPFGELGQVDLSAALQAVGNTVCGGMALAGGTLVTFRHSVPLEDLSINEFEAPLALVTGTADRLEQSLTGGDKF